MTEQTAAVEVWARMLCAADVHVHGEDHPTWQQLVGEPGRRIRDDYRKAAAWLLPRLTVAPVVPGPATDQAALRDRIAAAVRAFPFDDFGMDDVSYALEADPDTQEWVPKLADAVLAVLPATTGQTAEARARAIHQPIWSADGTQWCQVCSQEEIQPQPVGWWVPWPCPTVQAVSAPLPATVDRATALREAVTAMEELMADGEHEPGALVERVREMADEAAVAQQPKEA